MALTAEYIKGNEFQLSTTSLLSVKEAAFKRAGYAFKHWKGEDSDGKIYNELAEDAHLTIDANSASLSAVWDIINYNITYNHILPVEHSNPSQYTIESDTITFIADPGRIGYTATFNPDKITKGSTGNLTTDVNWNTISYNITYTNLLDGTHSGNPTTYNIETETITFNNPTRTGYTGTFNPTQIVKGTYRNQEITAVWNAKTYNITCTDDDPSRGTTTTNIDKVIYGNEFVVTVTPASEKYSAKLTVITGAKKVEGKDNTYTPDDSSLTILISTTWNDNSGIITYYPGY